MRRAARELLAESEDLEYKRPINLKKGRADEKDCLGNRQHCFFR